VAAAGNIIAGAFIAAGAWLLLKLAEAQDALADDDALAWGEWRPIGVELRPVREWIGGEASYGGRAGTDHVWGHDGGEQ
jgi:hypothetical protein